MASEVGISANLQLPYLCCFQTVATMKTLISSWKTEEEEEYGSTLLGMGNGGYQARSEIWRAHVLPSQVLRQGAAMIPQIPQPLHPTQYL